MDANKRVGLIFYLHGNAGDAVSASKEVAVYQNYINSVTYDEVAYLAVCMEYPGYGCNYEGSSSVINDSQLAPTAAKLLRHLQSSHNIRSEDVIVIGRSIGTGVACQLANMVSISHLVLISPFTNLKDVVKRFSGGFSSLVAERFDNVAEMKKIAAATLVLHGKNDALIPASQGKELAEVAPSNKRAMRKFVALNGDHNNLKVTAMAAEIATFVTGW